MNIQDVDHIFKVLIIGDSSVGKSNILLRFSDNIFHDTFLPTIGVDFAVKTIKYMSHYIKLQIWDTAGQERYRTFTSAYFKDAHGLLIVYDVTCRESFTNVHEWMRIAYEHIDKNKASLILIGNKTDLSNERDVSYEEGADLAKEYRAQFIEVSAFNNASKNISRAFYMLVREIAPKYEFLGNEVTGNGRTVERTESQKINLKDGSGLQESNVKKGCC